MEKSAKNVNQSMQLCKLIAAIFVVFIHVGFPGKLGMVINCIARFAVPIFFTISGYFSYLADDFKIKRRIVHILKLNIIAIIFYTILNIFKTKYILGGSVLEYINTTLNMSSIVKLLIINVQPIASHLWYLSAILVCYIILWFYVRFFERDHINYTNLYIISIFTLLIHIVLGTNSMAAGMYVPYHVYRNAIFFGLPMFGIGLFIHQYQERIIEKYVLNIWKEIIIIVLGILFSIFQYQGIGKTEMPIGMIFVVIALMMLMISHPNISILSKRTNIINSFSNISLIIYIIHPAIQGLFKYLHGKIDICVCKYHYFYPIAILFGSIAFSIIFIMISNIIKYLKVCIMKKIYYKVRREERCQQKEKEIERIEK